MKLPLYFLFFIPTLLFSQTPPQPLKPRPGPFFNELSICLVPSLSESESRTGYGFGAYRVTRPSKPINLVFGFDYSRNYMESTELVKSNPMYGGGGRYTHSNSCDNFTIPFAVRLKIGFRKGLFFDFGTFFAMTSYKQGAYSSSAANLGLTVGTGIIFPISSVLIVLKSEFRQGLTPVFERGYDDDQSNSYLKIGLGIQFPESQKSIKRRGEWDAKYGAN